MFQNEHANAADPLTKEDDEREAFQASPAKGRRMEIEGKTPRCGLDRRDGQIKLGLETISQVLARCVVVVECFVEIRLDGGVLASLTRGDGAHPR